MGSDRRRGLNIKRRTFLVAGATGVAALALGLWKLRPAEQAPVAEAPATPAPPSYGDWRDVYREAWRWDRIACGTHTCANCVSACAWNLYVRDGIVWREEQSAPYEATNATVPDFNPRGCQKGASYSDLSLAPSRVTHPLRRVGPRGSGRWKRISWDEALDEVAGGLLDVLADRGGEGVVCELGGHLDFGPTMSGTLRFFRQIGAPIVDVNAMVGDLPVGGTITLGEPRVGGSSDDWFRSDYVVLWACNPTCTRIPDAHFLNEARYRGARVAVVAPDYNQSAVHADLWLPVRPGTDAALALAACNVVVEEGLADLDYVREQTDLPLLVREDDGRFLRRSDVEKAGEDDVFAFLDESTGKLRWAPGCQGSDEKTLRLPDGVRPALDGRTEVRLATGQQVAVRPVFAIVRERLSRFTPEWASRETDVAPGVIRRFAREFAGAGAALIIAQYGMCKNYHSDLAQRSQILLASLTGNLGKPGGGWRSLAFLALDGMALVAMQDKLDIGHLILLGVQSFLDPIEVRNRFMTMFVSSTMFHAVHGELAEEQTNPAWADPALPRSPRAYLDEAIEKGHFSVGAPAGQPPEAIVSVCGNILRHARMGDRLRDGLFARARVVVDVTMRMSETARHADVILPAAGWYEKLGIKYIPAFTPYVTMGDRAVDPLGESKPEWEIFALLAQRMAVLARERGIESVRGFRGDECSLTDLDRRFTDDGRFGPGGEEGVVEFILKVSSATRGISTEDLRGSGGAVRLSGLGPLEDGGVHSDYARDEPIAPLRHNLEKKQPYPTLTGRQQFYVDHPWFLEVGEELPTYKRPPMAGGNHPFTMTGGHTRWSIHAVWRDHTLMLHLQRGEPVVLLNEGDARARGIGDHDRVRVFNDLGDFIARAKPTAAVRPGQVHLFHAWEPYQFEGQRTHQYLCPSPIKVTQLVGDYGQLHYSYGHYDPNQVDRDTRVDIARA